MKLITKPSVYIVGRQTVAEDELNRFLADHETTWESDSEVGAEVLSETAGRLCFDDKTELLTEDGWKNVADVSPSDFLATLNPLTRALEYQEPLAVHSYDFEGELLST